MAVTPYEEKKYLQSDAVTQAQQALQAQAAAKPGAYQSQWQGQMNDILGQIQDREPFAYDVNSDALYQQVAQNYLQQGRQAMMDTMGRSAAMTGGYGSSYAQTAGQQAYNQYLTGLTQLVPQYQQMAFQRYQAEGEDLLNRYDLLAQQEVSAYDRYQDDLSRYYGELDRLQSAYDSERSYDYGRFVDDRNFDYGKYTDQLNHQYKLDRDRIADDRWLEQWLYQQERDRIADEQWQKEYDEMIRQYNETLAFQQAQAAAKSSGRSSGGTSAYQQLASELENGDYSSAEMLRLIRESSLTDSQQDKLVTKYQKPKQTEEVLKKDPAKDTSAYWSSR